MPATVTPRISPVAIPDAAAAATSADLAQSLATSYDFGGLVVRIDSSDACWLHQVAQRFRDFAVAGTPRLEIVYRPTAVAPPSPRALYRARQQPASVSAQGRFYELTGKDYHARYDREAARLEIAGPLAIYPLDQTLQVLWSLHHPSGLMLHAAALASAKEAWLLSGPSGTGKSTLAAIFPEHALCDEMAAVHLEGERAICHSLPFWSGRRGRARLSGIYLLQHGDRNRRRRVAPAAAFHRLSRQVIWPLFDRRLLRRALDSLATLCERVSVWELHFRPDREVWELLTRSGEDRA